MPRSFFSWLFSQFYTRSTSAMMLALVLAIISSKSVQTQTYPYDSSCLDRSYGAASF